MEPVHQKKYGNMHELCTVQPIGVHKLLVTSITYHFPIEVSWKTLFSYICSDTKCDGVIKSRLLPFIIFKFNFEIFRTTIWGFVKITKFSITTKSNSFYYGIIDDRINPYNLMLLINWPDTDTKYLSMNLYPNNFRYFTNSLS